MLSDNVFVFGHFRSALSRSSRFSVAFLDVKTSAKVAPPSYHLTHTQHSSGEEGLIFFWKFCSRFLGIFFLLHNVNVISLPPCVWGQNQSTNIPP